MLVKQLVDDVVRVGPDQTVRWGRIYGDAAEWVEALEDLWVAPPLIAGAAQALGVLQWRFGDWQNASQTLGRYGSRHLQKMTSDVIGQTGASAKSLAGLIDTLCRDGRWPGEWVARGEALQHLTPACDESQLSQVSEFISKARNVLANATAVVRGHNADFQRTAQSSLDGLELALWRWISPAHAVRKAERWLGARSTLLVPSEFIHSGVLGVLRGIPLRAERDRGALSTADIEALLVALLNSRLEAAVEGPPNRPDLESTLDYVAGRHVARPAHRPAQA
jgi:hypothetical protein